jgi:uncharacterized protein
MKNDITFKNTEYNQKVLDVLAEINPWWGDKAFRHNVINRDDYVKDLDMSQQFIEILLGARRVGKTSIMVSLVNQLLDSKVPARNILFVTADNPFLSNVNLSEVIQQYMQTNKLTMNDKFYIFVDEIQDIKDWQLTLKYYYDNSEIKFVVSGSSSLLINQQAKKLTGRINLHTVWTLSLSEAMVFNSKYTLQEYTDYGGYPEVVLGLPDPKRAILQIVDSTVYRDLIGLYGIQNPKKLIDLIRLMSEKVGSPVSFRTIAGQLEIDDATAKKLVEYLVSIKLLFELPLFTMSTKKALRNPSKYYFHDNGIISCFALQNGVGTLAENLVAIKLAQTYSKSGVNFGYIVQNGQETDFAYGNDRFEVKHRDDWMDSAEDYASSAGEIKPDLTLVIPLKTNITIPGLKFVELAEFLTN